MANQTIWSTWSGMGVLVNSVCMELAAAHQPSKHVLVLDCQIGHSLAATWHQRLMQQARRPNEVPACMLAFSTMYAK